MEMSPLPADKSYSNTSPHSKIHPPSPLRVISPIPIHHSRTHRSEDSLALFDPPGEEVRLIGHNPENAINFQQICSFQPFE